MKVQKRRRRENKTNYLKRLKLLKSGKPRIVFRKTNRYIIAQLVESEEARDRIIIGLTSKKLIEFGWPNELKGSLKSIPASYLTGYLLGREIKMKKIKEPILDFGMIRVIFKSKVYAFSKGLVDAGVQIKSNEELFPEQERIEGKSIKSENFKDIFEKIKTNIDKEVKNG